MAFQKKYYYQYTTTSMGGATAHTNVVEIWEDTASTITAEEITGGDSPFTVELPEIDNKFQVVRGKGCALQMLSDTDMKFYDALYTSDAQGLMVKHYIHSTLDYCGYLNSKIYREPYDSIKYITSQTGTDGLAITDRLLFVQTDGSDYTGMKSQWELLQIVFDKINLPWSEICISLATTFTSYSGSASSTILHETYINCANFYDEDDKPMSMRDVLESILSPYGASIEIENSKVYITDIHTRAGGGSITWKRFNASTYAYIASTSETIEKSISSIGYLGTGQSIERSGGINRQVITYSPYPQKEILGTTIASTDEFTTVPASYSTNAGGYHYKTLTGNAYWNVYSPATFELSYNTDPNDFNIYLRYPKLATSQKVADIKLNPFISVANGTYQDAGGGRYVGISYAILAMPGEVLLKTKPNPYDDTEHSIPYNELKIYYKLKIGNKYIYTTSASTTAGFSYQSIFNGFSSISDKFFAWDGDHRLIVITASDVSMTGDVVLEIWSDVELTDTYNNVVADPFFDEIWIKGISLSIKDKDGNDLTDNDYDYIGNLDEAYQNEGSKITLTEGTNKQFTDRAKLMKYVSGEYSTIDTHTRNSQTFKIEELLLGSVSSNYRSGFTTLNNMRLKNNFYLRNVLTDTYISGKKMMVKSAKIDYRNNLVECNLVEISQDELIIQT